MGNLTPRQAEALKALADCGGDLSAAAELLGVKTKTIQRYVSEARLRGGGAEVAPDPVQGPGLIPRSWRVTTNAKGEVSTGQSGMYRPKYLTAEDVRAALKQVDIPKAVPQPRPDRVLEYDSDVLDVIVFGDPHLGMLAHREECGLSWDTDKGMSVHAAACGHLLNRGKGQEVVIVLIGDVLHANDHSNMTPRSRHVLSVDSRHWRTMSRALEMVINMGRMALCTHDTVTIEICRGNHDPEAAMYLALSAQAYFSEESRISVPYDPREYKGRAWGRCFVGYTHSDKTALKNLPMIYATEYREEIAKADRCVHLFGGHKHSREVLSVRNTIVERVETLAPQDPYAAQHGYRSNRSATMYSYHAEHGKLQEVPYNVFE